MSDEIEKLRAENFRLGSDNRYYRKRYADMSAEIERLRDENKTLRWILRWISVNGPDADGLVWLTIAPPSKEFAGNVSVGREQSLTAQVVLRFDEERRKALEDGR
jgi:hypothetical protein